jgi:D-beta-D-heptose 7-phosphate kinase/D-beta-D-heptose 1-phosphate adenosyltransferase
MSTGFWRSLRNAMQKDYRDKLGEIVSNFRNQEIAVIGDLILDEFVWGRVSRISPEAPVPIVEVSHETVCLGGAANVALTLAALGARPRLAGVIGLDPAGKRLLELLRESQMDHAGVLQERTRQTTIKTRIIAHHQQVCRTDREYNAPLSEELRKQVIETARVRIDTSDAVILSDYAKGVLDEQSSKHLIDYSRQQGRFVAVDPKTNNFLGYCGASVITPNKQEAEAVSGVEIRDQKSLEQAGRKIVSLTSAGNLLITRGEEGMCLFEGETTVEIPTVAREVFDVTGAGDTVIAVLTLGVAAGASVYDAAVLANHAAGVVVGKLGTASVSVEELLESLSEGV